MADYKKKLEKTFLIHGNLFEKSSKYRFIDIQVKSMLVTGASHSADFKRKGSCTAMS